MFETKRIISEMISDEIDSRATQILAEVVDYDYVNKLVTVELSNPTGVGNLRLANLLIPESGRGIVPASVKIGSVVILNCPQGNYTHAEIVAIKPPQKTYQSTKEEERVPRTGTLVISNRRIR